jgi:hypothetical protein
MATVTRWWALTLIACGLLAGCGLTQTVTDGTVSITKSIFYKKIKTLHLDLPRARPLTPMAHRRRWRPWCEFISSGS